MGLKERWAELTGARLEPGAYRYDGEGSCPIIASTLGWTPPTVVS